MRLLVSIARAVGCRSRYPLLPVSIDDVDHNFSSLFTNGTSTPLEILIEFRNPGSEEKLKLNCSIRYLREDNSALITDISIVTADSMEWRFAVDTDAVPGCSLARRYSVHFNDVAIQAEFELEFEGLIPVISHSKGISNELFNPLSSAINAISRALKTFAQSVVWIGPLRHVPARHSILTCYPNAFSADGRETLQLLHSSNPRSKEIVEETSRWFEQATSRKLSVSLSVENNTEVFSVSLAPLEAPAMVIPISEHGAGMSQVLPIVVLCAAASLKPENPIWQVSPLLIFENPELHLHDAVHETLAALFLKTTNTTGVRIVAETHSENVLLTTQLAELVKAEHENQLVSVNWVRKGESGYSEIDQFEFDENGSLGGLWSKSIFGYTPDLARRVMMLKLQKKSSGEANAN